MQNPLFGPKTPSPMPKPAKQPVSLIKPSPKPGSNKPVSFRQAFKQASFLNKTSFVAYRIFGVMAFLILVINAYALVTTNVFKPVALTVMIGPIMLFFLFVLARQRAEGLNNALKATLDASRLKEIEDLDKHLSSVVGINFVASIAYMAMLVVVASGDSKPTTFTNKLEDQIQANHALVADKCPNTKTFDNQTQKLLEIAKAEWKAEPSTMEALVYENSVVSKAELEMGRC